jgi:hypothetical protein
MTSSIHFYEVVGGIGEENGSCAFAQDDDRSMIRARSETPRMQRLKSLLRGAARLMLWPVVAGYMLLNDILWPALRPLIAALASLPVFARLADALRKIPPYPAMALFLVPFAILEPLKLVTLWWAATGHVVSGTVGLLIAHGLTVLIPERLFSVLKPTLLTLPWFAAIWSRIVTTRDKILAWVRQTRAFAHLGRLREAVRHAARRIAAWVRAGVAG